MLLQGQIKSKWPIHYFNEKIFFLLQRSGFVLSLVLSYYPMFFHIKPLPCPLITGRFHNTSNFTLRMNCTTLGNI